MGPTSSATNRLPPAFPAASRASATADCITSASGASPWYLAAFAPKVLGYGALSGVLVAGIIYFMAESLAIGDASIVLPIQQMSFLATFFLGVFFLKEKITIRKLAALACGVVALLLLSIK